MQKVIFVHKQAPGDLLMLSAAIRDLHKGHPNKFLTDLRTNQPDIFLNNPYLTKIKDGEADIIIEVKSALINQSSGCAKHFIHSFKENIEKQLGISYPITAFKGDIHLSKAEMSWKSQIAEMGIKKPFWILVSGGKFDFTSKYWPQEYYQEVINHFKNKILFVHCGKKEHFHPKLDNCIDLIGKTSPRQFIRLMYHAIGAVCPITYTMHLAAATPSKYNLPSRPCIVIAGGLESPTWEAYPNHNFLHSVGTMKCCSTGGCWKSKCSLPKNKSFTSANICKNRVNWGEVPSDYKNELSDFHYPKCMTNITPKKVISAIEDYHNGDLLCF